MKIKSLNVAASIVLLLALSFATAMQAQQAQPAKSPEPQTKLELFQAKTGGVIVKNFSEIGSMDGQGGKVTVTSREFIDAQTGRKEYGLSIEIKEDRSLEREDRAFVDYDEIDSLLKGIDYVSAIDKSVTKLKDFQADYRTTGSLRVSVYSMSETSVRVAIGVGRISSLSVSFRLDQIKDFRKMIVDAKAVIDAIK
ncbi:MAG TPA: hypothetical protein VHE60_08375 [Pyrinomonadaceae bacterium]|nr:hypothetical protein [Pyrinomonadaceae bacterium]